MPPYPKEKLKECIRRCDTRNADDFKATLREIRTLVDKNDLDLSSETLKWSPPSSPHAKRGGEPPPPHHKNTSNVFIFTLLTILNSRCMLQDKNSETTVFNCWLELLNMIFKHYAEIPPKKVIANGAPFSIYGIRQKRQDLMYPIKMVLRFKPYWIISKKEEDKEESMADRNAALILAMFHRLGYNFHDENQDLESHLYTALHENKRHCFDFLATQMRLKFKKNDPPPLIHAIYYDLKTHANPQKSKLKFLMDCCGSQHDRLKLNPNQTDFADYDLADEDKTGGTALHFIIHKEFYKNKQAIMYLQNIGVDPHAVNRLNKTGIDLLKEKIERASRTLQRAMDPHLQRLYVLYGYIANWMDQTNHHSDRVSTMAQMGDRDSDVEEVHSEEEQQHSAASTASAPLANAAEIRPSTARARALHAIIDDEPHREKKSHAVLVSTPRDVRHAERASPHQHKIQSRKKSSGEEEESEEEEGSNSEESESDNNEQPPIRSQTAALTRQPKRQIAAATSSSHPHHHRELPRAQKQRNKHSESEEEEESESLLESEEEESQKETQPPRRYHAAETSKFKHEKPSSRQNAASSSHREQPHHHSQNTTPPHLQQRQARRGEPQQPRR